MGRTPPPGPELRPRHVGPQPLADAAARAVGGRDERLGERKPPRRLLALEAAPAAAGADEVPDLVQGDEVAHLAPDGRDADLEPPLGAPVTVPDADHDRATPPVDAPDPVPGAEVVHVEVEGSRLHRERSVVGRVAVTGTTTIASVIALSAGFALLIGWYRGCNRRSLELAAAVFAVVLAAQTLGLVLTGREPGAHYWPTVAAVAAGWIACVWVASRARRSLTR
jgi:hypothetical protein